MRPVHEFQANFSQTELASDAQARPVADGVVLHADDGSVRNLCLVWADGRRAFFNYAYLVSGDLTVQDGINTLVLSFGTYTVIAKGYHLRPLFDALLEHKTSVITAINPRYLTRPHLPECVVTEIIVKSE